MMRYCLSRSFLLTALLLSLIIQIDPVHVFALEKKKYPDLLTKIEQSGSFAPMFPFVIGPDVQNNITNVTVWPESDFRKNISDGGLISVQNGTFTDSRGARKCFLGTNLCFPGCFPDHEKARQCAQTLARFGINIVRMHYVHHKSPVNKKYASPDSFIEPIQLERFDFFINELKKNGIYTDLTLNIGRKFGTTSGFKNADKLPWYNNGIDNIDARMIELHKKFTGDLLTHVNPYTGLSYRDDPAVAFVEIANENSIVASWYRGSMDDLPEPYASNFQRQWNEFLSKKYRSDRERRTAWGILPNGSQPKNLIPDGYFSKEYNGQTEKQENKTGSPQNNDQVDLANWGLQQDKKSEGTWTIIKADPDKDALSGKCYSKLQIDRIGLSPNIPQFFRRGLTVVKDKIYTVSFKIKTDKPSEVSVRMSQDHKPWGIAGVKTRMVTSDRWEEKIFSFRALLDDNQVRIVFADFEPEREIDLADIAFYEGLNSNAPELQGCLEDYSVPVPKRRDYSFIKNRDRDLCEFLYQLENNYFQTLYTHLKKSVRCPHPVSGTQLNYGYRHVQESLDYCDIHAYWHHPFFPNKKWDSKDWYIKNLALVNAGFAEHTMLRLGQNRILGKPFTVSEYDHAYPNLYAAEGDLIYSSFGAFQNWDAVFQFAWSHSDNFVRDTVSPMFDLCSNQVKLVHLPACYAMFVRGDVRRGPGQYIHAPKLSLQEEIQYNVNSSTFFQNMTYFQGDRTLSQIVYTGLDLGSAPTVSGSKKISSWLGLPHKFGSPEKKRMVNEFGEIVWDFQEKNAGFYQVDTARTKVLTGFIRARNFSFKGFSVKPGKTRTDWLALSFVQTAGKEDKRKPGPGKWLLAATGLIHNTEAKIAELENNSVSIAVDYGGSNGVAPVLCEGIPAEISLLNPDGKKIEIFALNPNGSRKEKVPVENIRENSVFHIDPKYQTLWYEIVIDN